MSNGIIKNTLVFQFPEGAAGPTLVEIARFVKAFDADKRTMESSYKISDERVICIKFKTEAAMKEALLQNPELHTFQYSNGDTVQVRMTVAGGCIRYVRVFDLPPEISELDVSLVLGRYGTVKRMTRERFPAEFELDLFTGVRGIHMDIKKEIPSTLYVANRRARVYYEGLKQRCFLCKEEGHLKADCPQNKRRLPESGASGVAVSPSEKPVTSKNTYAGAVIGTTASSKISEEPQLSMVKLVSAKDDGVAQRVMDGSSLTVRVPEDRESEADSKANTEEEPDTTDELTAEDNERTNKRPLTASSKSGSDDGGVMFVTVDRSRKTRKQKRCDEDAERPNPLAVIAAAVRSDERITRSKSRRQQEERSRSRSGVKVSLSNAATDKC